MDHEEQLQTVKKMLDLDSRIVEAKAQLTQVSNELEEKRAGDPPAAPELEEVPHPVMPKVDTGMKMSCSAVLLPSVVFFIALSLCGQMALGMTAMICWPVMYACGYWIIIAFRTKRIKRSKAYQEQCEAAEAEYRRATADAENRYGREKQIYDNETLPAYQREKAETVSNLNQQIQTLKAECANLSFELEKIYEETGLIPIQYRSSEALRFLYDTLRTSNYDVLTALNLFLEHRRLAAAEDLLYFSRGDNPNLEAEDQGDYSSRFLSDVIRTAVGVAIGNKISGAGKRNHKR